MDRDRGRALVVMIGLVVVAALAAVPVAGASSAKHKPTKAKDRAYELEFTGTGTWSSDYVEAVEGANQCENATDTVHEGDQLSWDVKYLLTVPAKGNPVLSPKGTYFKAAKTSWTQTSTVAPSGCLGGNQDCSGDLNPATAGDPPVQGWDERPEATIDFEKRTVDLFVNSVLDWVVSNPTGSSSCSVYAHYHSALEPFALAKQIEATTLTVAHAMTAIVTIPRAKLGGGSYVKKVNALSGQLPPQSCQPYEPDSISCSEKLSWNGKLEFKPSG